MTNETRLRVRYAETDRMGVVYHSNYLIWFEVGRVEFLRQLGFVYKDLELEEDCHIAVVDVRCKYKVPARYDDCILVRTRLRNVRESVIHFDYEVLRESDATVLAVGETTHVVVTAQMNKRGLPEKYLQAFRAAVE
jgi:acyl-CoA thioester hydrolase